MTRGRMSAALAVALIGLGLTAQGAGAAAGKIAFTGLRGGGNDQIFVIDGNGGTPVAITPNTFDSIDPSWSPNGKLIANGGDRDGVGTDQDMWIMNADGSAPRQLTFSSESEYSYDWAPTGLQLTFSMNPMSTQNINRINFDGSGTIPLASFGATNDAFGAHWSPDGTTIVFTKTDVNGQDPLFLMNPDGSNQRALTTFDGFAPDYTADGKRIVFYSNDDPLGTNPEGDNEIFSIAVNGTDVKQLTTTPAGPGGADNAPSPSRDGLNRIAWTSRREGDNNREIFRMNADGSGVTQLTFNSGGDENRGPDWEPTAKCGKKVATIVGTSAGETLVGGPGPDIFSAQAGNDRIKGKGGNDTICGDKGNDKLIAGKGKKDTCIGGKGKKDTAKGCDIEKKVP